MLKSINLNRFECIVEVVALLRGLLTVVLDNLGTIDCLVLSVMLVSIVLSFRVGPKVVLSVLSTMHGCQKCFVNIIPT